MAKHIWMSLLLTGRMVPTALSGYLGGWGDPCAGPEGGQRAKDERHVLIPFWILTAGGPADLTVIGALMWSRRRPVVSVVIGGRSANGRRRGAAGARRRRGRGGGLQGAAVQRTRMEWTTGRAVALGQSGGGSLQHNRQTKTRLPRRHWSNTTVKLQSRKGHLFFGVGSIC